MIVKLTGSVSARGASFIIFDVGSVGYRLEVPLSAVGKFSGEMTVFTHEVHREDAHEMFAFLSQAALELFWKLISISGVGPKIAQKIVFSDEVSSVRGRIMKGDLAFLTSISGVGMKTAQKIVLELKGVLLDDTTPSGVDADALEALVGLGYTRRDAQAVLERVEAETTEERIRLALRLLSPHK